MESYFTLGRVRDYTLCCDDVWGSSLFLMQQYQMLCSTRFWMRESVVDGRYMACCAHTLDCHSISFTFVVVNIFRETYCTFTDGATGKRVPLKDFREPYTPYRFIRRPWNGSSLLLLASRRSLTRHSTRLKNSSKYGRCVIWGVFVHQQMCFLLFPEHIVLCDRVNQCSLHTTYVDQGSAGRVQYDTNWGSSVTRHGISLWSKYTTNGVEIDSSRISKGVVASKVRLAFEQRSGQGVRYTEWTQIPTSCGEVKYMCFVFWTLFVKVVWLVDKLVDYWLILIDWSLDYYLIAWFTY